MPPSRTGTPYDEFLAAEDSGAAVRARAAILGTAELHDPPSVSQL